MRLHAEATLAVHQAPLGISRSWHGPCPVEGRARAQEHAAKVDVTEALRRGARSPRRRTRRSPRRSRLRGRFKRLSVPKACSSSGGLRGPQVRREALDDERACRAVIRALAVEPRRAARDGPLPPRPRRAAERQIPKQSRDAARSALHDARARAPRRRADVVRAAVVGAAVVVIVGRVLVVVQLR